MSTKQELQLLQAQRKDLCEQLAASKDEVKTLTAEKKRLNDLNKALRGGKTVKNGEAMSMEEELAEALATIRTLETEQKEFRVLKGVVAIRLKRDFVRRLLTVWRSQLWRDSAYRKFALNDDVLVPSLRNRDVKSSFVGGSSSTGISQEIEWDALSEIDKMKQIALLKREIGIGDGYKPRAGPTRQSLHPLHPLRHSGIKNLQHSRFEDIDLNGDGFITREVLTMTDS